MKSYSFLNFKINHPKRITVINNPELICGFITGRTEKEKKTEIKLLFPFNKEEKFDVHLVTLCCDFSKYIPEESGSGCKWWTNYS